MDSRILTQVLVHMYVRISCFQKSPKNQKELKNLLIGHNSAQPQSIFNFFDWHNPENILLHAFEIHLFWNSLNNLNNRLLRT